MLAPTTHRHAGMTPSHPQSVIYRMCCNKHLNHSHIHSLQKYWRFLCIGLHTSVFILRIQTASKEIFLSRIKHASNPLPQCCQRNLPKMQIWLFHSFSLSLFHSFTFSLILLNPELYFTLSEEHVESLCVKMASVYLPWLIYPYKNCSL